MSHEELRIQLQNIATKLQTTAQQRAAVSGQLKEISRTIQLLSTQDAERAVYRKSGEVLLEVADREELLEELQGSKVVIEQTLEQLTIREQSLKQSYDEIVTSFEG